MMKAVTLLCATMLPALASSAFCSSMHPDKTATKKAHAVSPTPVSSQAPMASYLDLAGTSWRCQWSEGTNINFVMAFNADSQFSITRDDGVEFYPTLPGVWNVTDDYVTWSDRVGRLYTVRIDGDTMSGRTTTLDFKQSRGKRYRGAINCNRIIDLRETASAPPASPAPVK